MNATREQRGLGLPGFFLFAFEQRQDLLPERKFWGFHRLGLGCGLLDSGFGGRCGNGRCGRFGLRFRGSAFSLVPCSGCLPWHRLDGRWCRWLVGRRYGQRDVGRRIGIGPQAQRRKLPRFCERSAWKIRDSGHLLFIGRRRFVKRKIRHAGLFR